MNATLLIRDTTASGKVTDEMTLEFGSHEVTVRELIRCRVVEEVAVYNAKAPGVFKGFVQPEDSERVAGGYRMKSPRQIDPDAQVAKVLAAFDRNGYFVIVNDRQVESLEDTLRLDEVEDVRFVRLMPLVGG